MTARRLSGVAAVLASLLLLVAVPTNAMRGDNTPAVVEETSPPAEQTQADFTDQPTRVTITPAPLKSPFPANLMGEKFPQGPPKPPPSNTPPPASPSGRWLFSMDIIDNFIYVYGGVGSYSTALYNDLWVYNYQDRQWSELQSNFVPPFPQGSSQPTSTLDKDLGEFHPDDSPPQPPMMMEPPGGPGDTIEVPLPGKDIAKGPPAVRKEKTISVVQWPPITAKSPLLPMEANAFLETDVDLLPTDRHPTEKVVLLEMGSREGVRGRVAARHRTLLQHLQRSEHSHSMEARGAEGAEGAEGEAAKGTEMGVNTLKKKMTPFIVADLWAFDLDTKLWSMVKSSSPDLPTPRWLHSTSTIGTQLVVFGGVSYNHIILDDMWVFKPKDKTWLKGAPIGERILPREGHTAVTMGQTTMYVFGGISYGHTPFNDLWSFDGKSNFWKLEKPGGSAPVPRWLHTAVVWVPYAPPKMPKGEGGGSFLEVGSGEAEGEGADVQEFMIIFGGVTRNWVPLDDLHMYDPKQKVWTQPKATGFPPFPRFLHSAAVIKNEMFVYAGSANNIPLEDMYAYELMKHEWREEFATGVYPFARFGHKAVLVQPPPPQFAPAAREAWEPPDPKKEAEKTEEERLMPLIQKKSIWRGKRFYKDFNYNMWMIVFGGAGPKP